MAKGCGLLVVVALLASVAAAPGLSSLAVDHAQERVETAMVTQSPAQAIEDAIRYDPDVAAAIQSNSTNLYLLKKVTYMNGTAEDLGLPKEELLPNGAPDRVQVDDKILYTSIIDTNNGQNTSVLNSTNQDPVAIHATVQLVQVPIN